MFLTGLWSAVFQPRAFQAWIQVLMPLRRYWLSVKMLTAQGCFNDDRASIAAVSSMRLLVVRRSPPNSSLVCPPELRNAPQPPGPGLPLQAPSV